MERQNEFALSAYSRAKGAQYLAFFGVFWLVGSLTLSLRVVAHRVFLIDLTVLAIGAPLAATIYVKAQHTKRVTEALAHSLVNEITRVRRARAFRVVNIAQYFALGIAGLYLSRVQRIDQLIPVGIFIIGCHFFPLAFLFKYPFHGLTGGLLIGWALVYPHVLEAGGWNPIGLSVTGIILLLSASWSSLTASRLAARALQ
jgi:hypothetical protein